MDKANEFLNKLLKNDDSIIVAVSGGPDSMALIHLFLKIKEKININLICAHINHNTGRIGQLEEEKYVKKFCKENNIIFEKLKIEKYSDDNFENEARTKRYNFFEELIKKYHAKYLATAHHADDLMETILMRIVRGSTLRGYAGFSKIVNRKNYKIIRPLIEITKSEIIAYNEKNKIKYYIDSTNDLDIHTRNRYRKYMLPFLKKEDENVHKKFYKYSEILLEYNSYIDKNIKKVIPNIYKNDVLKIDEFLKMEKLIKTKIINFILEEIYQDDLMLITDRHVDLILNLIKSKKANSFIYLPNNLKVIKNYNELEFVFEIDEKNSYEIEIIDFVSLPNGKSIKVLKKSEQKDNFICRLKKEDVLFPLYVRTRKNGDKMHVKGMNGTKKINDIFIDKKIKTSDRDTWPIVVDSKNEIVWLPGLKKSKFDKPKEEKCDIILKYY